jgi:hypothetical protein
LTESITAFLMRHLEINALEVNVLEASGGEFRPSALEEEDGLLEEEDGVLEEEDGVLVRSLWQVGIHSVQKRT